MIFILRETRTVVREWACCIPAKFVLNWQSSFRENDFLMIIYLIKPYFCHKIDLPHLPKKELLKMTLQ